MRGAKARVARGISGTDVWALSREEMMDGIIDVTAISG